MPSLLHSLFSPISPSPIPPLSPSRKLPFSSPTPNAVLRLRSSSSNALRCSLLSVSTESPSPRGEASAAKPSLAEASRTIMELSSTGTFSTLTRDGWPLGVGARFIVDATGAPALCLPQTESLLADHGLSSFHVRLEHLESRTPQCTLLGSLRKPEDDNLLKKLCTKWEKKYGEEVNIDLIYLISVERVFHSEDFKEDGAWVSASEYLNANPDPLRNFAEKIVSEMNSRHAKEIQRLCNVYVEPGFKKVADAKMIWVDRLGFDLYIYSEQGVFAARIPFPREVTDEKGVKSSFNLMSHLAWEIEKNYITRDFEKVKSLKKIR